MRNGEVDIDRADEAKARARAYQLLALGFSPPSVKLDELSAPIAEILRDANPSLLWFALEDRIKALEASIEAQFSDTAFVRAEYHRLFVGPYSLVVPPYESMYRATAPIVMGESTLDVMKQYEQAGFLLSPSYKDLPDHIAAELEFMALLCEEEEAAWQSDDLSQAVKLSSRQETFLRDHLVQWIPDIASKLLASTTSPFYRALASLARDYVSLDLDFVRALGGFLEAKTSGIPTQERTSDGD
jgi:TorA maturation chaperone TorD